ncbi:MAG: FtsX-like permease family protein [Bacteroidales bacterium]|jgi:ABC-type antimicrobial peptide transport system permease subunit
MMPGILQIVIRSLKYYKKPVLYQVLIIALLSAVITGSLLTGRSVKNSLKKSASERLGNTGILISSGVRYFGSELAQRIRDSAKINCTGILEINGYCQSLISQKGAFNIHIYGLSNDFFTFHGNDLININPGEVAVNKRLADYLRVKPGDDLIIRFTEISDIPEDAPFAPSREDGKSVVMRIGTILKPTDTGNFSLLISQITPMNIFINLTDIEDNRGTSPKINRLLIGKNTDYSISVLSRALKKVLKPSDIGFRLRKVKKTGEFEFISDRVFIDGAIVKEISNLLPSSAPALTYLGNRFAAGAKSTPYSFVSALPSSLYPEIVSDDNMIINRWMANDLSVSEGDTVQMYWYSPDSLNNLIERSSGFIVKRIVDMHGIWSDSLLMPDFPGISGRESCSDWDAGVPIKMKEIRPRDEDYWNRYRGTPKAFINYEKGNKLWGNNFGPATTLRFPVGFTEKKIEDKLNGSLDPDKTGFSVTDLSEESVNAANESVDFGTLFLSLGFFLILASIVLLSFAVTSYFDSKRVQIHTLFAVGFKNRWISQLLFLESGLISLIGCSIGAFAGYLVNIIVTTALNSVWNGAVQTDTLNAYFNLVPLLSGFIITFLTTLVFMLVKIKLYFKMLNHRGKEIYKIPSPLLNLLFLLSSIVITISLFALSVFFKDQQFALYFATGTTLLLTLVLFWRQYFISGNMNGTDRIYQRKWLSHLYYSFYPSHAVTPILFIAAGIFTVFITSVNRMNFNEKHLNRSGGTGGYLLWCENTIPLKEDLNTVSGRKTMGLDNDLLSKMSFVFIKRSSGNDASCLNLNHVTTPPLLGIDPSDFIVKKSFSFSKVFAKKGIGNPWNYLDLSPGNNTIYGIADQTVLDWGLKLKPGDTLILRAENGRPLNIIIAAGLQSSVFQGNVIIGKENFKRYFPSVSGSSVLLVDGDRLLTDLYKSTLTDRLENYGVNIEKTTDRLSSFYEVTNTYLSVFGVFGGLGMVIGIAGLGFVLLRNYDQRKREFALMLATGFQVKKIRRIILSEQMLILFAGVSSGIISALVATLPSIKNNPDIPWLFMILMISAILITGLFTLLISVRSVTNDSLTESLKKE